MKEQIKAKTPTSKTQVGIFMPERANPTRLLPSSKMLNHFPCGALFFKEAIWLYT